MIDQSAFRFRATAGSLLLAAAVAAAGFLALHRQGTPAPVAASGLPIAVLPAAANGVPDSGVGFFTVTAAPGQTVRLHALILNRSARQPLLTLAPVDAYRIAGGLAYALPDATPRGVGAWIRLSTVAVRLSPSGHHLVTISLHIPSWIGTGTYAGALSIGLPEQGTIARAAASMHVQMRLAVAVVVRVHVGKPA
jgi:hypothetical protein